MNSYFLRLTIIVCIYILQQSFCLKPYNDFVDLSTACVRHTVYFQIQRRLETEKNKLEQLEAEHRQTGRSMKDDSHDQDEHTAIMLKYRYEQQELELQRQILDDLEFQMFEAAAPLCCFAKVFFS